MSANDDERIQLVNSIEPHAYWTSKDVVSKKEEILCNIIIKQYKHHQLWLCYKRKPTKITQIGHKFLIIHTEY